MTRPTRPFARHVLVCTQQKPDGAPCCAAAGGVAALDAVRAAVAAAGLADDVLVTGSDCLGLCERGPNAVVHPEGSWYTQLDAPRIERLVGTHLVRGVPAPDATDPDAATVRVEVLAHRARVLEMKAALAAAGALPEPLNQLVRGFQASRVVLTAVELDVFSAIARHAGHAEGATAEGAIAGGATAGGATVEGVAAAVGAAPRGVTALLNALVALGLLTKGDGRYRNGAWADAYLRTGALHDARAMLQHIVHLWPRWSRLTECVREGTAVEHDEMVERGEAWTQAFIGAMHHIASLRAPQVVGAIDLGGVRRVLDLGGGSGAYAIAFARACPEIEAVVFDLPTVTPLTRGYAEAAGVGDRVRTVDGDLRTGDYGSGFDLVFISAICHMLGPDENLAMLGRARRALGPGGRVIIQDFIPNEAKTAPAPAALFAINMLVGTRQGDVYTASEYSDWLLRSGFVDPQTISLPGPTDLVVATSPA